MSIPTTTRRRHLRNLFPCLLAAGGLGIMTGPARCQPPAPTTESIIDSVEADWQNLRRQTGAQEFLDPQSTITSYQAFYEKEGFRSGQTAVEITGIIAQLYWQGLNNSQKALSIYDWGIKNFGFYRGITNLKRGREVVANSGNFSQTLNLYSADIATQPLQKNKETLKPVTLEPPVKVLSPGDQPIGSSNPFAPVTLTPPADIAKSTFPTVTAPATGSMTATKVLSPVTAENKAIDLAGDGKSITPVALQATDTHTGALNAVTMDGANANSLASSKVLSSVTLDSSASPALSAKGISIITPPAPVSSTSLSGLVGIDPRQLVLANAASAVRNGNISSEDFLTQNKPTPQEALWMLSAPGVIISWDKDRPLRVALIGLIQEQAPQLLQAPEQLPQPTQMALANYYESQRNPKAEAIYQILIKEKAPDGVWWPKLWVMNAFAEYYGVMGEFDKAALAKLAIQSHTTSEMWVANTNLEAARFYMQAGETEKAQKLYEKAEKSTYGWAVGVVLIDHGRLLLSQHKYNEAIKVLSQPVQGNLANQIEPVKRMLVGDAYYQSGDLLKAQENIKAAVTAYRALQSPLTGEGLENIFASAEKQLQTITQWIKEPIQVAPKEVHIAVDAKQLQNGPVIARLHVRTYREAPLTVTTDNKNVTAQILPIVEWNETGSANANQLSEKVVIIKITAMPPAGGSKVMLTISSTQYAGFQAQVPVFLEVAGR